MNYEIIKGQIRSLIIVLGGIGIGWFAAKGWITTEQATAMLSSPLFLSLATALSGFAWSAMTHTQNNAVAVVTEIAKDKTSPVRGVLLEPTIEGHDLAGSIEGPVAVAGTAAADEIAFAYRRPSQGAKYSNNISKG